MKTKLKDILLTILLYVAIYIICSAVFIALFHTPLFSGLNVLMYRGIILLILAGILSAILMVAAKKFLLPNKLDAKDVLLMFCGFCCVNMVLFTLIPVTVERSVSVFMLSYMEEHADETFTEEEIQDVFIDIYVKDFGAFQKRFEEQLVTGSIEEKEENAYQITDEGKAIVKMFRIVAKWFNTDDRGVYPTSNQK